VHGAAKIFWPSVFGYVSASCDSLYCVERRFSLQLESGSAKLHEDYQKIGREFSGFNILESGKRLADRNPLQCSLYVTDRCSTT